MGDNTRLHLQLEFGEHKFVKACSQVSLLDRRLDELKIRHDRIAACDDKKAFCVNLRLQMSVMEGVRGMFYEYATIKAEELTRLKCQLQQQQQQQQQ